MLLTEEKGESFISGADLALAVIDENETPAHQRVRFTVAYGALRTWPGCSVRGAPAARV